MLELNEQARTLPRFVAALSELLPRLCQSMMRHESNYLSRGHLTLPQFWVLEYLDGSGPCPMSHLVAALQWKSSTATMVMDRLFELGLVRRGRDHRDRRVVEARLTPRGRRILDQIHHQKRAGMREVFRPLTQTERARYLEILEKLNRELTPVRRTARRAAS